MKIFPLSVSLPGGVQADHVAGTSEPPRYTVAGEPLDLDVTIPDDLIAAGWHWHGSILMQGQMGGPCIAITTDMYPPPGCTSERRTCIEVARSMERHRAEWHERRVAERVAKVTKSRRPKHDTPAPAAVQMELF